MSVAVLLLAGILLAACTRPDTVDEKTFVECYARILIIKTTTTDTTAAAARMKELLDAHHISKDLMQEQLKRYADDPPRYRRVLAAINDRLRQLDSLGNAPNPTPGILNRTPIDRR